MRCPNCGLEMEDGYLSAGGYRIKWTPKARSFANISTDARDIPLQKFTFTGKNNIRASVCRNCRKVVLDY